MDVDEMKERRCSHFSQLRGAPIPEPELRLELLLLHYIMRLDMQRPGQSAAPPILLLIT